ncbi:MAG: hypothetical protein WBG36_09910, partial [Ornithinimicrobium sp.]
MSQQTHRGTLVAGSLGLAIGLTMAGCGAEDPESSDGASSQTQEGQDSATTEETASESPADRTITIAASGDELPHAPVLESA